MATSPISAFSACCTFPADARSPMVATAAAVVLATGATLLSLGVVSLLPMAVTIASGVLFVAGAALCLWLITRPTKLPELVEDASQDVVGSFIESVLVEHPEAEKLPELSVDSFIEGVLAQHPEAEPTVFKTGVGEDVITLLPPLHTKVARLITLYQRVYLKALKEALVAHPNKPLDEPAVIEAADNCMKIAYAIGCYTLAELPEVLQQEGESSNLADMITDGGAYGFVTFYYCPVVYFIVRKAVKKPSGWFSSLSRGNADCFYETGSKCNSWRELYNDYCDRAAVAIPDMGTQRDQRPVIWTRKDHDITSFEPAMGVPPSLPRWHQVSPLLGESS